jgi:anti-sigma B factor antagonist
MPEHDRSSLRLETLTGHDGIVVVVHGDVDLATAPQLGTVLQQAITGGATVVELDLAASGHIDSAGLNTIAAAIRELRRRDGRLALRSVPARTLELLTLTGLAAEVDLHD